MEVLSASAITGKRVVRSPRGTQLSCKSWLTEAAYRMLQNLSLIHI